MESDGGPLLFRLYNSTGDGIRGFHYDPVFEVRPEVVVKPPRVSNVEGREGKGREDREGGSGPRRSGRLKPKDGGSAGGEREGTTSGNGTGGRAPVASSAAVGSASAARATAVGSAAFAPAAGAPTAPRGRLRRMGRAAEAGAPRIVMGFGDERIDDVRAYEANMEADALDRHEHRVNEGDRGRMRDADGRDLDRSAGGAWHAGRRF